MTTIFPFLELLTAISVGILAGALLTEANVLVPYWRKMNPKEFLALHHQMGPSLYRFFAPITIAGTSLPIVTLIGAYGAGAASIHWWAVPAVLGLVMLGIYFLYFKKTNQSFETASIAETELAAELSRWAYWHNLRTVLAVISAIAALLAISM